MGRPLSLPGSTGGQTLPARPLVNPQTISAAEWAPRPAASGSSSLGTTPPVGRPWRDSVRRESGPDLSTGLYASNDVAPRSPSVRGDAFAVGGSLALGGVAYSGGFVSPNYGCSSSFSFSLFLGGGWGSVGFSSGNQCWWAPSCFGWSACGGWAPFCGWAWPAGWCGPGWCTRPFWCPPLWCDPWCAPVAWSSCWSPGFSLCFGYNAWATSWLYTPLVYQPEPPPVVVVQPPAVVLGSADTAWALLGAGYDSQAMEMFASLNQTQLADASTLIGYGLAQAFLGIDTSAAIILREAVRQRAENLLLVPSDPGLRNRLAQLATRLQAKPPGPVGSATALDDLFLRACVQAILYDNANAYFSISSAIDRGDRDLAAFALKDMLRVRLGG